MSVAWNTTPACLRRDGFGDVDQAFACEVKPAVVPLDRQNAIDSHLVEFAVGWRRLAGQLRALIARVEIDGGGGTRNHRHKLCLVTR